MDPRPCKYLKQGYARPGPNKGNSDIYQPYVGIQMPDRNFFRVPKQMSALPIQLECNWHIIATFTTA